jgi:hypothetical protein
LRVVIGERPRVAISFTAPFVYNRTDSFTPRALFQRTIQAKRIYVQESIGVLTYESTGSFAYSRVADGGIGRAP